MVVYTEYTDQPARYFRGVAIEELHKVELVFWVNITIYELGEVFATLVRRSLGKHADTMFLNLYETDFSYIRDMTNSAIRISVVNVANSCENIRLC